MTRAEFLGRLGIGGAAAVALAVLPKGAKAAPLGGNPGPYDPNGGDMGRANRLHVFDTWVAATAFAAEVAVPDMVRYMAERPGLRHYKHGIEVAVGAVDRDRREAMLYQLDRWLVWRGHSFHEPRFEVESWGGRRANDVYGPTGGLAAGQIFYIVNRPPR